jgi:hypothetical protein
MALDFSYTARRYEAQVEVPHYVEHYNRAQYFLQLCKQCKCYGNRYGCPPFDSDPLASLSQYSHVLIVGFKVTPSHRALPLAQAGEFMAPITAQLNAELLNLEKQMQGYALGFVGSCPYCADAPCARVEGKPCLHPDKVRPSLEAYGFDLQKTAQELLGIEIKWSKDDKIPEYLTLIGGVFYTLPPK